MIDIHCHTDELPSEALERFVAAGGRVGAVAMGHASVTTLLAQKVRYGDAIYLFLGCHPEVEHTPAEVDRMLDLIDTHRERLAGIGEVGIPHFNLKGKSPEDKRSAKQVGAHRLSRFVEAAARQDLPLNLHVVRHDVDLVLPLLDRYQAHGALFHWFNGSIRQLNQLKEAGHFISAGPDIFYDPSYFKFVQKIPLEMLLLESDGPWPFNDRPGEPMMVFEVLNTLAAAHHLPADQLRSQILANTARYLRQDLP